MALRASTSSSATPHYRVRYASDRDGWVWRWFRIARHLLARIGVRLLAFNLLLVFVAVGGVLYLVTNERQLRDAQERGMIQQGRLLAAVLADEEPLDRARIALVLQRLDRRVDARLRIVDRTGQLLGDSSAMAPQETASDAASAGIGPDRSVPGAASTRERSADGGSASASPASGESAEAAGYSTRSRLLYRIALMIVRIKRALFMPRQPFGIRPETGDTPAFAHLPEVKAALAGRYGAATRLTGGQRSVTFYSAIPIRRGDTVVGAVVVSQSTFRLLTALYEVRLDAFRVVVWSVLVATILSAMLTATIARPLARLRADASARLDRRRGTPKPAPSFAASRRRDEIGDLARALDTMTDRLAAHADFVESFAADVSHELKNPIAALRAVSETLAEVDDPADRARFMAMLTRDVDRLDRLVSSLREIIAIDAQLDREPAVAVELAPLLQNVAEAHRLAAAAGMGPRGGTARDVRPGHLKSVDRGEMPVMVRVDVRAAEGVRVLAAPDRLAQVFANLVDNAVSFSPSGGIVTLALTRDDDMALVTVVDEGPGIPEAHLPRIFDRFFSYRPADGASSGSTAGPGSAPGAGQIRHTGLGLAIVRALVDGYGGSIAASNEPGRGARFDVRLPLAD